MNIIEAVKDGRRFRRGGSEYWFCRADTSWIMSEEGLASDDWEIDEKKVEVTEEQVKAALCKNIDLLPYWKDLGFITKVCKDLGLT